MRLLILVVSVFFMSACSTNEQVRQPHEIENTVTLEYFGSRNDIFRSGDQAVFTTNIQAKESPANSNYRVDFPLSYAVFCNAQKSECKHAVVKSSIKYKVVKSEPGLLTLVGTFSSEMGRSKSLESSLSRSGNKTTSSVASGVPIISEERQERDIYLALAKGEKVILNGISGDRVALYVQ
ncbi:hypothetical protein FHR99_000128 [Litorivivens lipolytica]|uniref:Lipoprotein n=1 Tax=Litorivivens lipolytica TaxID=1524264 RepID=A0A7W4W1V1_9GAMM|nr:hypothetical protein [Litorivivens lipolytica]MBB3045892.1 hypothetical protein [Litorivivens lipolytica]